MKRLLALLLVITMLLPLSASVNAAESPSSWAATEVNSAIAEGLVPSALQKNYTKGISRLDLAKMIRSLLDKCYTGSTPAIDVAFSDTYDADVKYAAALGIITGYKQDDGTLLFKPSNTLKRSEMAVIISRVARVCGVSTTGYESGINFTDTRTHWCNSELGYPVYKGIVKGTSATTFSPENTLTVEQTIMMIYRTFNALNDNDGVQGIVATTPSSTTAPSRDNTQTPSQAERDYVLNKNTKKFHYPTCASVGQMKSKNRWNYTGTRDSVIAMGYDPCKKCNP